MASFNLLGLAARDTLKAIGSTDVSFAGRVPIIAAGSGCATGQIVLNSAGSAHLRGVSPL